MEIVDETQVKIEYYADDEEDPLKLNFKKERDDNAFVSPVKEEHEDYYLKKDDLNSECENSYNEEESGDKVDANECRWYKEVDETGTYLCVFCPLTYNSIPTLRYHVKRKHPTAAELLHKINTLNKRKSKFECYICKTVFSALPKLTKHVEQAHLPESKNFCHLCHATFDNIDDMYAHLLQQHKRNYSKIYLCNFCGYRTGKVSHYNQHLSIHSGKKLNKCKCCDYATNNLSNLKTHERIHSKCKPHKCPTVNCNYSASTRKALCSHLRRHKKDENLLLYCDKCPYTTFYKQSLKKHSDTHNIAKVT